MQKLSISANRRYFVKADGTPFIWLADTAWTMPQRLKWDDVKFYMEQRKRQGFTVLQIVALDPEQDREIRNPAGIKALDQDDLLSPNEAYFEYLDWILDQAEAYGFYVLLLPAWGELVVGHNWMGETSEKLVHAGNAYAYGRWIGSRYKNRSNILWCLGGDRQPVHLDVDYRPVWRAMAEGLAKGLTGLNLKYDEPDARWKDLLITYHACHEAETGECSTLSYWTDQEAWISYVMLQSGHGLTPKNYDLVQKEYNRKNPMPVWDGEPAYECMPTSWPVIKDFHGSWIVRKRAYWSLFAGSFGHTYGHSSVWCMISEKEKDAVRQHTWFSALDCPGAWQVKILRDFLESLDLSACEPAQDLLILQPMKKEDVLDEHVQACRHLEGNYACLYFPSGGREKIKTDALHGYNLYLWWFNPRDGLCYSPENSPTKEPARAVLAEDGIEVSTPTRGPEQDWILVIGTQEALANVPVKAQEYGKHRPQEDLRKVFAW